MKKKMKIFNSGNYVSKATNQFKHNLNAKTESGGDLRANKTGGQKAK